MRGDPAKAPADSPHRAQAQHFADAGQEVEPYFAALARLLRPAQVAQVLAKPVKPRIFVSYSHMNLALLQRLRTYLGQYYDDVSLWTDQDLRPGEDWQKSLQEALAGCQLAVLLVSVDFNSSKFIKQKEMSELQRRHAAGELQVVPVAAGACKWDYFPWVDSLQWVNARELPLLGLDPQPQDSALQAIAARIHKLATPASKDPPA